MVGYLDFLRTRRPEALTTMAFVTDGPLAVFGPQAWLHQPVMNFIQDLAARLPHGPVIIGVEKTGQFPEDAQAIADYIGRRQIMALPDDYIYSHVLTFRSSPNAPYGRDTYYGQNSFTRPHRGASSRFLSQRYCRNLPTVTIPGTTRSCQMRWAFWTGSEPACTSTH